MSELEISNTRLQDSGVQVLMDGVEPESCKMESLRSDQIVTCYILIQKHTFVI